MSARPLEAQDIFTFLAGAPLTYPVYVEVGEETHTVIGIHANGGTYGIRLQCDGSDEAIANLETELSDADDKIEARESAITDAMQALEAFENEHLDGEVPPPPLPLVEALNDLRKRMRELLDEYRTDL